MFSLRMPRDRVSAWRAAPIALAVLAAVGCGGTATTAASAASPGARQSAASAMDGMDMAAGPAASAGGMPAGGITPVPAQVLGTADWQGMKITAKAMTAVPFTVYDGTTEHTVKPGPKTSFHLMVLLTDAQTGVVIPYAGVWATITNSARIDFDERLWPMISRYMGPHYGNDVALPGTGSYRLSLLVSPPVSARHTEYQDVWLQPHRVTFTFHWEQRS